MKLPIFTAITALLLSLAPSQGAMYIWEPADDVTPGLHSSGWLNYENGVVQGYSLELSTWFNGTQFVFHTATLLPTDHTATILENGHLKLTGFTWAADYWVEASYWNGAVYNVPSTVENSMQPWMGSGWSNPVFGNWVPQPVPEPTTLIAGALLLLPFGAHALRSFRKRKG